MKIFVDMDSTLNDFVKGYVDYYNEIFNKNISIANKDLKQYEISKNIEGIAEEEAVEIRQIIFSTEGFWLSIPPQKNAIKAMKEIVDLGHDVYILTAPWKYSINCYPEKIQWVRNHKPWFDLDKVIFCRDKYLIHGDIIIDDNPHYLRNHSCEFAIAPIYPFNKEMPAFFFDDWENVPSIVEEIKHIKQRFGGQV